MRAGLVAWSGVAIMLLGATSCEPPPRARIRDQEQCSPGDPRCPRWTTCDTPCCAQGTYVQDTGLPPPPIEAPEWTVQAPTSVGAVQADEDGILVEEVGEDSYRLARIDASGALVWRREAERGIVLGDIGTFLLMARPFVAGSGWFALDPRSGDVPWTLDLPVKWSPRMLGFDADSIYFSMFEPVENGALMLMAIDARTGATRWSRDLRPKANALLGRGWLSWWVLVRLAPGFLRVGVSEEMPPSTKVYDYRHVVFALDPSTGAELWSSPEAGEVTQLLVDDAGRSFVGATEEWDRGNVRALDVDGVELWSESAPRIRMYSASPGPLDGPLMLAPTLVFYVGGGARDRLTGEHRYEKSFVSGGDRLLISGGSGFLFFSQCPKGGGCSDMWRELSAFDLASGQERWNRSLATASVRIGEDWAGDGSGALRFFAGEGANWPETFMCKVAGDGRVLEQRRLSDLPIGGKGGFRFVGPWIVRSVLEQDSSWTLQAWPGARQ